MITHWKSFWEGKKNQKIIKKSEEKTRRNHYSDYIFGDIFPKIDIKWCVNHEKDIFKKRSFNFFRWKSKSIDNRKRTDQGKNLYVLKKIFFVENFYLKKEICSNKSYLNILSNKSSNISTGLFLKSLFCTEIWLKLPWEQK